MVMYIFTERINPNEAAHKSCNCRI